VVSEQGARHAIGLQEQVELLSQGIEPSLPIHDHGLPLTGTNG
jgi:hypothetical protein